MEVVERLFAEAVARAEEPPVRAVVDDEGPHAVQPLDEAVAPLAVAVEQHLGVGVVGDEFAAARLQLRAEFGVVVDLAVEDDAELAVARPHRLRAAGEIDDREAAMAEEDARAFIRPMPVCIRPAMRDGGGHPPQHAEVAGPAKPAMPHMGIADGRSKTARDALIFRGWSFLHIPRRPHEIHALSLGLVESAHDHLREQSHEDAHDAGDRGHDEEQRERGFDEGFVGEELQIERRDAGEEADEQREERRRAPKTYIGFSA